MDELFKEPAKRSESFFKLPVKKEAGSLANKVSNPSSPSNTFLIKVSVKPENIFGILFIDTLDLAESLPFVVNFTLYNLLFGRDLYINFLSIFNTGKQCGSSNIMARTCLSFFFHSICRYAIEWEKEQ
ncbi:hypothetical protein [Cuneatibacter caecimuris]|uniref:hypothetical protein n=1 Tax=Cuneatibacter caecimuris TaxID=1796618 RepID=UPI00102C4FE2|nr:hypothetical protein [Cuneatibacter caecimuris]